MSLARFMEGYVETGRLDATLIKLKVPFEELEDMRQSVICHFLDKGFLSMYDEEKGSFSNHVYVGIRNFVVDFFRKQSKKPYTLVLVSSKEEDLDVKGEISQDIIPGLTGKDVEDPLLVKEIESLLSSDIAWRPVSWSLSYYERIQHLLYQANKYRIKGDQTTCFELKKQAHDLQDLEECGFSHLLVFKLYRLGYTPTEISEFTAVSPSRISGMWNELASVVRDRLKGRRLRVVK